MATNRERADFLGKAIAQALSGATLADRWIIEGLLGIGGMGVVLAATDGPDGAPVVAKVIAPQLAPSQWEAYIKASRLEALALRRLSDRRPPSPYIVRFFDEGEAEVAVTESGFGNMIPIRYLILEFVDGGPYGTTLHDRIHRSLKETGHGFAPNRARRLLRHIARALSEIHAERLIHRDLKPSNVLITGAPGEEVAKVTDFGIVRAEDDSGAASGIVAVSVGYSAPEQYVPGNPEIGTQSDIFSFGALTYEVLTGCALFPQEAQAAVHAARRSHRHSLLDAPTVHEVYSHAIERVRLIDQLIAYATNPKRENRPSDVREYWRALDAQLAVFESIVPPNTETQVPKSISQSTMPAVRAEIISGESKRASNDVQPWRFRVRGQDSGPDSVRDVAPSEDGKALAVGDAGVRFWDGRVWLDIPMPEGIARNACRCVARLDPDRYVVGGTSGFLAFLTRGNWHVLQGGDKSVEYTAIWGNEYGTLIAAGARPQRNAILWVAHGGEWLAPRKVQGVERIHSIAGLREGAIAVGAARGEGPSSPSIGALMMITSQTGEVTPLRPVEGDPPVLHWVTTSRFGEAMVVGASGFAARVHLISQGQCEVRTERVETTQDLTGARFDETSQVWAVAQGRILARTIADDGLPVWRRIWWGTGDKPSLVQVAAGHDFVFGFSREGLVVEGRASPRAGRVSSG